MKLGMKGGNKVSTGEIVQELKAFGWEERKFESNWLKLQ